MNLPGDSSVTSKRSKRAGVALAGQGRDALGVDQHQAQNRQPDGDQAELRGQRVLHALRQGEEEARPQGEEKNITSLDDQRLGAVGAGHQLAPEDGVGPGPAVGTWGRGHPPVRPPRDVQARSSVRSSRPTAEDRPGAPDSRPELRLPRTYPRRAVGIHSAGADGEGYFNARLGLAQLGQRFHDLGLGLVRRFPRLVAARVPDA